MNSEQENGEADGKPEGTEVGGPQPRWNLHHLHGLSRIWDELGLYQKLEGLAGPQLHLPGT